MSTRKLHPRTRALRPSAEGLETRQLLAATVSGIDVDGDQWTLRLVGPGALTVVKQNGADGNPAPLASNTEISKITIGGTNPLQSRLIGTVKKGPNGDGKVFFENFTELANRGEHSSNGDGPLAIAMPGFWLGVTSPPSTSTTTAPSPPSITIPDGTATLEFGGVDTTHGRTATPPSTATSDRAVVSIGVPAFGGVRIVVDKSISSTESVPPASGSSATTPTTIQHAVVFEVSGRLNLFQANEIKGDATNPPGQFSNQVPGASGFGGTWVISGTAGAGTLTSFLSNPQLSGGLTGSIGNIRIGGNATNLSAMVFDATGTGEAHLSNFSIGGETNNILVVAPNGSRNLNFGNGMDEVQVYSHVINTLQANRGALNSTVVSDRTISRAQFGGPVEGTNVLSGYQQNFSTIISDVTGQATVSAFSPTPSPAPPPQVLDAQIGGGMQVLVAGDVTNSVFAASVQPFTGSDGVPVFGTKRDLKLPDGHISAKVEGVINNSGATPDSPNKAFFAQTVKLASGPVIPPNAPQQPYPGPKQPTSLPGVSSSLQARLNRAQRLAGLSAKSISQTPKGPNHR